MTKKELFKELIRLQELVWSGGDQIGQEELFEVQNQLANILLKLGKDVKGEEELVRFLIYIDNRDKS